MSRAQRQRGKNSQVPLFISKLVEMLENSDVSSAISWTSTNDSFIIKNVSRFTEEVLPIYFKHRNFASFIRQLNMYGFRKTRHSDGDNVYLHDHFKLGSKHLLKNIVRKVRDDREEQIELYRGISDQPEPSTQCQIQELKTKHRNLEEMCKKFIVQNQKLMEENLSIMAKMQEESREKDKRIEELLIYFLTQNNQNALCSNSQPISISNQAYNDQPSPLQILGKSIDQNENMKKMRDMMQNIYGKRNLKKKDNNFTIVNQQQNSFLQPSGENIDQSQIHQIEEIPSLVKQEGDNQSFLSINDFFNVEDELF